MLWSETTEARQRRWHSLTMSSQSDVQRTLSRYLRLSAVYTITSLTMNPTCIIASQRNKMYNYPRSAVYTITSPTMNPCKGRCLQSLFSAGINCSLIIATSYDISRFSVLICYVKYLCFLVLYSPACRCIMLTFPEPISGVLVLSPRLSLRVYKYGYLVLNYYFLFV